MSRIGNFIKRRWPYILVAFIFYIFGCSVGPSQDQVDKAVAKNKTTQEKLDKEISKYDGLVTENDQLQDKYNQLKADTAPWFKLTAQQQANNEKEAEQKAADLKKKEDEKKAEEKRQAAAKAKAALAAKAKTLSAGKYIVGRDIDAGLYDCSALSGQGNFIVTNTDTGELKVNEMFGVGDSQFFNSHFNNLELEDGDTIEINDQLRVKFSPKE